MTAVPGTPKWYADRIEETTALGIASAVAQAIRDGMAKPGDQLPQVRVLAQELRVSPSTISAAWLLLRKRGLVSGLGKAGTRVAEPAAQFSGSLVPVVSSQWDLRFLYPDGALLPSLAESLMHAARLPNLDEYYTEGIFPQLRAAIAPTWPFEAEEFSAVSGISDGVRSALRGLSVPGDRIAVESATNPPLVRIIRDLGLVPVEVDLDGDGPVPASLAEALRSRPVAFLYQPRAQVPTGLVVTEERIGQLAKVLGPRSATVVEFDDLNDLSTAPANSIGQHLPHRTILLRSYEKAYGPDLRLAVVGGPSSLVDPIHKRTLLSQQWVSRILQSSLAWLIEDPGTQEKIRSAARIYASRRTATARALTADGITTTAKDGLCLWIEVLKEDAAIHFLATHGVLVHPGSAAYPKAGPPRIRVATSRLRTNVDEMAKLIAIASSQA